MMGVGIIERHRDMPRMSDVSKILFGSLVQDTVCSSHDGFLCGRRTHDALCSVSLPWTRTLSHRLFPLPFPASQPATALARGRKHIDPRPDLGGRAPVQMLMRPEVVVDCSRVHQRPVKRGSIFDRVLKEQPFYRADEPLDAAVLPGAARFAVLQTNPHTCQRQTKRPRSEHRLVIRAQHARAAILTTGGDQIVPDRPRRLVRQPLDTQAGPAGMIDDRQRQMWATRRIGLGQQVHPPDQIARHRTRHAMLQFSAQTQDGVLLPSDRLGDVGFADGHLPTDRESPVEGVHDRAAARLRHQRFQPNEFTTNPFRLGRRVRSTHRPLSSVTWPIGRRVWPHPTDQPSAPPDAPLNEPGPQTQHRAPLSHSCAIDWTRTS